MRIYKTLKELQKAYPKYKWGLIPNNASKMYLLNGKLVENPFYNKLGHDSLILTINEIDCAAELEITDIYTKEIISNLNELYKNYPHLNCDLYKLVK